MLLKNLSELSYKAELAVIINVNTKLVTTLALLSAIKYAEMPVLLIECESNDGSLDHFIALMERYDFDILTAPLNSHGKTLDWIFKEINSEKILLIDSDLEIEDPAIITFFKEYIDEPNIFGCGFLNGPGWLNDRVFQGTDLENALFHERPWMPLTFLRTAHVREAISLGKSFADFRFHNEYSLFPIIDKLRARYWLIRRLLKQSPTKLRRSFHGLKPSVVFYDTGAQIFEYLRYEKLMFFACLPEQVHPRFVTHFFGVTRNTLNPEDTHGGGGLAKISKHVRHRLQEVYGEEVS